MTPSKNQPRFVMIAAHAVLLACGMFTAVSAAYAQDPAGEKRPQGTLHIVRLQNTATQADQNEVLTAVRNTLSPSARIFLIPSENDIVFRGSDEDFAELKNMVAELDRPHHLYRLTFAVKDSDGGRQLGLQHFSVVVAAGQRVQLKEGSRVPIVTGTYGTSAPTPQTQFTYIDVGMNFDATIAELVNGLTLRSKVERSTIAEEKDSIRRDDPVIRQNTIEGSTLLTLNKPITLGSLDTSGSTRHVDIEVTAEMLK